MKELDALPTVDELSKAIESLTCCKAPGSEAFPQRSSMLARRVSSFTASMNSYFSVGRREQFLRTWEMLTSSHSTRTKEAAVTVTTIATSPC